MENDFTLIWGFEMFYLVADQSIYIYVPRSTGNVVDGVPAATEEQQRRVEAPHEADATGVAVNGQVQVAEPVAGERVAAALHHDGLRLEQEASPPLREEALGALVEGHGHHPVGPDEGGLDAIAVVHVDVHVQHAPEVPEELVVGSDGFEREGCRVARVQGT